MPRARLRSSEEKVGSSRRASTSAWSCSSSIGVERAWHSPTPRTSRCSLSPRRTCSIPSTGMSSSPNPAAARTPSAPTIAPASASKASVARSIASRIAAGSSSAVEIAARNSVSCWAAQLVGTTVNAGLRRAARQPIAIATRVWL